MRGAIAETANRIYEKASPDEQERIRDIFLRLTHVDEEAAEGQEPRDTRQRVQFDQLVPAGSDPQPVRVLVQRLAGPDARLVVTSFNEAARCDEVEVSHEELIRHWDRLQAWLNEDRAMLRLRNDLGREARAWEESNPGDASRRDDGLLWRGARLDKLVALSELPRFSLSELEASYRDACVRLRAREQDRERRRNRLLAGVAAAAVLLAIVASVLGASSVRNANVANAQKAIAQTAQVSALKERDSAEQQRAIAEQQKALAEAEARRAEREATIARSRQLAAQSTAELGKNNYETAALLAIESGRITDTLEAFSAVRAAVTNPWHSRRVFYDLAMSDEYPPTVSPDGNRLLVFGCADRANPLKEDCTKGLAQVYDIKTWASLLSLDAGSAYVVFAGWSHDGRKIMTWSYDGSVSIWEAETGIRLLEWKRDARAFSIAPSWSHDDGRIIADSDDGLWVLDAKSGNELIHLSKDADQHLTVSWSRDDSRILIAKKNTETQDYWGDDELISIASSETGKEILQLKGHTSFIYEAAWSYDDQRIATASADGTARIWDTKSGAELRKFESPNRRQVLRVVWSNHDSRIIVMDQDKTYVWDAGTGQVLPVLDYAAFPPWAYWSSDDRSIVTKDSPLGHSLAVLDAKTGNVRMRLDGHTDDIRQASWTEGKGYLVSVGDFPHAIRVWDVDRGNELPVFASASASWGYDDQRILQDDDRILTTAGEFVQIWDTHTGQKLRELRHGPGLITTAWSPDNRLLITATGAQVSVWVVATGQRILDLHPGVHYSVGDLHLDSAIDLIEDVGFDPGQRFVFMAGDENDSENDYIRSVVSIWDTRSGDELFQSGFYAEDEGIGVTWSESGSDLLVSDDTHVEVFETNTWKELASLEGYSPVWNRDQTRLMTTSDNASHTWDAETWKELLSLEGRRG